MKRKKKSKVKGDKDRRNFGLVKRGAEMTLDEETWMMHPEADCSRQLPMNIL